MSVLAEPSGAGVAHAARTLLRSLTTPADMCLVCLALWPGALPVPEQCHSPTLSSPVSAAQSSKRASGVSPSAGTRHMQHHAPHSRARAAHWGVRRDRTDPRKSAD